MEETKWQLNVRVVDQVAELLPEDDIVILPDGVVNFTISNTPVRKKLYIYKQNVNNDTFINFIIGTLLVLPDGSAVNFYNLLVESGIILLPGPNGLYFVDKFLASTEIYGPPNPTPDPPPDPDPIPDPEPLPPPDPTEVQFLTTVIQNIEDPLETYNVQYIRFGPEIYIKILNYLPTTESAKIFIDTGSENIFNFGISYNFYFQPKQYRVPISGEFTTELQPFLANPSNILDNTLRIGYRVDDPVVSDIEGHYILDIVPV